MKRLGSLLAACVVLTLSIPVFAADTEMRYVPQIPPFLSVSGNSASITAPFEFGQTEEIKQFLNTYKTRPYIVAVDQLSTNGYYMGKYYGDDRLWRVMYVTVPEKSSSSNRFGFF